MPAAKMTTRPFLEVADGAAADERLGDRAHLDGGHDARDDALLLERVLQREGVDDGRQHAHVVGRRAVHAAGAGRQAAEDVAAADDDGGLDAEALDLADVARDARGDRRIDAELLLAHEGFAGQLEERAFVDREWQRAWRFQTTSNSDYIVFETVGVVARSFACGRSRRVNCRERPEQRTARTIRSVLGAFADAEPDEAADLDVLAGLRARLRHELRRSSPRRRGSNGWSSSTNCE